MDLSLKAQNSEHYLLGTSIGSSLKQIYVSSTVSPFTENNA